jgi:hypothetical protein
MDKKLKKLFGKKNRQKNLITHFLKLFKKNRGKKSKLRELEMQLLKPEPIPKYRGAAPVKSEFKQRTIICAFPNPEHVKHWADHFKVATYIDNNTWDVDFLIELFNHLESGRLIWDKSQKKYKLKTKDGRRIIL